MNNFEKSVLNFIAKHNTMSLSTVSDEGLPCSASLFYVNKGFIFYFVSGISSLHSRNIASCPLVSITINKDYSDWRLVRGLQIRGRATEVGEVESLKVVSLYFEKYEFMNEVLNDGNISDDVRFYKVIPEIVRFIDNTRGFGHKEEIKTYHLS